MPMKKLRNWRSTRQMTRQTRSRSRKQKEAIRASTMAAGQTEGQPESSKLSIFINDFTDSDNEASAEVWAWILERNPGVKGIYIAEPRWVNLGYYMTSRDFGRCIGIVARLQPPLEGGEPPLTTVLAGRMTEDIINSRQVDGRPLNHDEKILVSETLAAYRGRSATLSWYLTGSIAPALYQAHQGKQGGFDQACTTSCDGLHDHHEGSM